MRAWPRVALNGTNVTEGSWNAAIAGQFNVPVVMMSGDDAVISPPWSIHAGCGTASYSFIWGMAGENQSFTDMDGIPIKDLK